MDGNNTHDDRLSMLLADEYASRILSATYNRSMSVQQLSHDCNIPIAVTYRRVSLMEDVGLVKCVGHEEVYRGKKVSYYRCDVKVAKVTFCEGKFSVEVDWMPSTDLTMNSIGMTEKAASP